MPNYIKYSIQHDPQEADRQKPLQHSELFPEAVTSAFVLGDYVEGPNQRVRGAFRAAADLCFAHEVTTIEEKQALYLAEKKELRAALRVCDANPEDLSHSHGVRDLAFLIDEVGKFPCTLDALKLVNGWVNYSIYHAEYVKRMDPVAPDIRARSLLSAVESGTGYCDEQARLKLFILEELIDRKKIDLKPSDVRWIGEESYIDEKDAVGHAITAVRIRGDRIWALNNQCNPYIPNNIDLLTAYFLSAEAFSLQAVGAHVGYKNILGPYRDYVVVPRCSFNAQRASYLYLRDAAVTETAPPEKTGIDNSHYEDLPRGFLIHSARDMLLSALSRRCTVDLSEDSLWRVDQYLIEVGLKERPKTPAPNPNPPSSRLPAWMDFCP